MIIRSKCSFFQNKINSRNGFTLIEIIIVLVITAILALLAMPSVYNAVVKIEKESTIESAAVGLNQFFIDARARSIRDEARYDLYKTGDDSLSFRNVNDASLDISYQLPGGLRTKLEFSDNPATYSYLMGFFCEKKPSYYEVQQDFQLYLLTADSTVVTLSVSNGSSKVVY
ncbi:MAG TPA: prepilin-type N-terminal cleavage/methylation domain-containing protein [Thermotogota bacterium]|nr:prepilin-type N-terminal cleavage/methylation domain-containing protein [Thermotogota bacterium]